MGPFLLLLMDLVTTLEHLLRMDTSSGLADTCHELQDNIILNRILY